MDKKSKEKLVSEYKKIFESSSIGILIESQGLNVEQVTKIRKKLSESGCGMRILKNRLAKIAAAETAFKNISGNFVNMRAFVYADSDPVQLAKTVVAFDDEFEFFKLNSALMCSGETHSTLSAKDIEDLSKLPSKEELIAKLLFVLNAPITNFARVLNEIPSGFARVIQAIADSKNQSNQS